MYKVQDSPFFRKNSRFHQFSVALTLFFLTGSASLQAQTTWTGAGADDNWFNNANWDTLIAPNGITTNVVIGSPSPTIANGTININSLTVSADGVLIQNNGLDLDFGGSATTTLNNAGSIFAGDNADLQLAALVVNSGTITATDGPGGGTSDLEVRSGGATLDGGGTVVLAGGAGARINGFGGSTLNIANQTIQGRGAIGVNTIRIDNGAGGLIDANVGGQELLVDLVGTSTNQGIMQASGGGILKLLNSDFDNTGGVIRALSGSVVEMQNGVTIDGGTLTGDGLFLASNGSSNLLRDLTFSGTMTVGDNADLRISGTIVNSGSITMNDTAAGGSSDLEVQTGGATLDGGGTIILASGPGAQINGFGGSTLNIANQTIQGRGAIGVNTIRLDNGAGGLIDANVGGQELLVDLVGTSTNQGIMQASGGGILKLLNSDFDNTGGVIQALSGSVVEMQNGVTIDGGTLTGDGLFLASNGSSNLLRDLTFSGTMTVGDNADLRISGTIVNSGSITMNDTAAGGSSDLEVQTGGATLDGGGTIILASGPGAQINGFGGSTLNIANQTIQGRGTIGSNVLNIVNSSEGLIHANVSGETLTIDPLGASTSAWTNEGTLRASNGGTLVSAHSLINLGTLSGDGTIEVAGGLVNDGLIDPGLSPGTLTIESTSASLGSTSQILIEIAGAGVGEFDLLDFNLLSSGGNLFLGGELLVDLDGYLPDASDLFVVLSADNLSGGANLLGMFDNVADGGILTTIGGEGYFTVSYGSGANASQVLLSDFVLTIPEPGSATVIIAGMLVAACCRRRRV